MDVTLWFLNRINDWEQESPGALARALAGGGGPRVFPGHRVMAAAAGSANVTINVNDREDCFPGELMHEGYLQRQHRCCGGPRKKTAYDEYFVPIPVKCFGNLNLPERRAFWDRMLRPDRQADFDRICDPQLSPSLEPAQAAVYWTEGRRAARRPASLSAGDDDLFAEFADVRMNTQGGIGYYEILQSAKQRHGKSVLVGYSQGGLVAAYLAYIDEHLVKEEHRCIAGILAVQSPLRGSTLGMPSQQAHVLGSLLKAVRPAWESRLLRYLLLPGDIRRLCAPWFEPGAGLRADDVALVLDLLYRKAGSDRIKDLLRTALKWLSGLRGDADLAFYDIDPMRLSLPGSVLHAVDTHPLVQTPRGAVAGINDSLEPLIRGVVGSQSGIAAAGAWLLRNTIRNSTRHAESTIRDETFDMMPVPLNPPVPPLETLHKHWRGELQQTAWGIRQQTGVPPRAHDFVIPSASQLFSPHLSTGRRFLGNYVNADASHISGATRSDSGATDFSMVCKMLKEMGGML